LNTVINQAPPRRRDRYTGECEGFFHFRASSSAAGGGCRVKAQIVGHGNLAPAIRYADTPEFHRVKRYQSG
jgi:hypothetical protein